MVKKKKKKTLNFSSSNHLVFKRIRMSGGITCKNRMFCILYIYAHASENHVELA